MNNHLSSFYDQPHIFVVFPPGGAGNFIAGLLNKILKQDHSSLKINENGSTHTVNNNIISFGNTYEERFKFKNIEEREKYYIEKIEEEYINTVEPIVSWSHNFSNIDIYKKYFKNSRVVCINQENDKERLSCIIMNVLKVIMVDPSTWPIDIYAKKLMYQMFKNICLNELPNLLKPEFKHLLYDIFENRNSNQEYKDLITFTIINKLLKYHQIIDLVKEVYDIKNDSSVRSYIPGIGITNLNLYTQNIDVLLPYNYLITENISLLISTIEKVIQRNLTNTEKIFIDQSFKSYLNSQNNIILKDPISFYKSLKEKCHRLIKI